MKKYVIILFCVALISCGKSDEKNREIQKAIDNLASENYVDTMVLTLRDFDNQIICNGKLKSIVKSELYPRHTDACTIINVRNGQYVEKGTLLAVTDETNYKRELERAEHDLEKTKIDLADKLISLGYYDENKEIPQEIRQRAEIMSGYYAAKYSLETAKINLADCQILAPISGVVANMEASLYQRIDQSFCTIIDNSSYNVEFSVLEAELASISKGQEVIVSPFIDNTISIKGSIVAVNPTVNEKGLIKVIAQIPGADKRLIDGMNVQIVCQKRVPKMFVVPKEAVVERDGYHVVFLLDGNRSRWTYVDIMHSNINSYAITGCAKKETKIKEGDVVITSGNLNLADDTEVIVNK